MNLEAKINKKTAFILEMTYCGLFKFPNVTEKILEKQIQVECPKNAIPIYKKDNISNNDRKWYAQHRHKKH